MTERFVDPTAHLALWATFRDYCLPCCFFDCTNCDLDDAGIDGCCCGRLSSSSSDRGVR